MYNDEPKNQGNFKEKYVQEKISTKLFDDFSNAAQAVVKRFRLT